METCVEKTKVFANSQLPPPPNPHCIKFGTRDSCTYVIFAIDIKGSSISSL